MGSCFDAGLASLGMGSTCCETGTASGACSFVRTRSPLRIVEIDFHTSADAVRASVHRILSSPMRRGGRFPLSHLLSRRLPSLYRDTRCDVGPRASSLDRVDSLQLCLGLRFPPAGPLPFALRLEAKTS